MKNKFLLITMLVSMLALSTVVQAISLRQWIQIHGQPPVTHGMLILGFKGLDSLEGLELIENPDAIKVLNFAHNELKSVPAGIGDFVNLQKLYLHNNQIQNVSGSIGNLVHLEELYLNDNRLQDLPRTIGNLRLKKLNLAGNLLLGITNEILIKDYLKGIRPPKLFEFRTPEENAQIAETQVALQLLGTSAKALQGAYKTVANVLNSRTINQRLAQVPEDKPEQLIKPEIIRELNQLTYDKIFELKKRYFEATKMLKEYADPLIKRLQEIMTARNQGASAETILSLIPPELPRVPRLEDIPERQLIEAIKQLTVE